MWRCIHPVHVVLLDVLGKAQIGFLLLHVQHLGHLRVCGTQFQLPAYQSFVDVCPVLPRATVHNLHGYLLELLLVALLNGFRHNLATVYVLFQRQQYLIGVHGLD